LAGAVALGVFIGCTPFYGFHLLLCIVFAKLLGLNRALTYLAAHVSLPGIWPLLVFAQLQVGRWMRGAGALPVRLSEIRQLDWKQGGIDLLAGSAVVGAVLAAIFGWLTYAAARRRQRHPAHEALIERTAYRYLDSGMFDWEFVRGKLRHDPVYFNLLRRGLLPSQGRLLDLGCGRGILPALLVTARELARQGEYPANWWTPPQDLEIHGIEGSPKAAAAARHALGTDATIETADLLQADLPPATAILLLDVLHYLPAQGQEDLLTRIAAALEPGGLLLLRDADAAGGWRFTATRVQERLCAMGRRHWRQRFHFRSAREWADLLARLGLEVDLEPMGMGTPYANVLIGGRKRR
jgi:SAM-dependent methyltransferase